MASPKTSAVAATTHTNGEAILQFRHQAEWAQWLAQNHGGNSSV